MATTRGPQLAPGRVKHHIVVLEATHVPIPEFDFPHTLTKYPLTQVDEVEERIKDADIVIVCVRAVTPAMVAKAAHVGCVIICAVGIAWLDKEGFAKAGVTVTNCPASNVDAVSEHALALYFGLRRKTVELDAIIKGSLEWRDKVSLTNRWTSPPRGVGQEVVGILGYGTIGKRIKKLFEALGAEVLVLGLASVVVVAVPKADDTIDLINARELELMHEDTLVINVARGGIVNEKALAQALKARRIGGAATDVMEFEPSGPGLSPLLADKTKGEEEVPNLIVSPHVAWFTQGTIKNYQRMIKEAAERWVEGTLEAGGKINPTVVVHNGTVWRNILIFGATGVIGNYITRAIVDSKHLFDRICVFTSEKTVLEKVQEICALESWGVEVFVGRLDDEQKVKEAYQGIDTIVSCVGRAGIEKQIPLITWAEECGVRRFFASEYGTDIEYWPQSAHEPPHQLKLKVRAHMRTMKKIEHTYLVTGPYSDLYFGPMRNRPELGSFDVEQKKAVLLGDGDGPVSFTAMVDVGKFVVAALLNGNASKNATLIVHSFTATPHEILAEFEEQTGTKWDVSYTSLDRLREIEKEEYQVYSALATVATLRRIWTQGGTLYKYYDESILGSIDTETISSQVQASITRQEEGDAPVPSLLRMLSPM
ncbi:hypothetical protein DV738_g2444, partial [Chaetothyriales sp. CBS 135597]